MKTRSAVAKSRAAAAAVVPALQNPRTHAYKQQSMALLKDTFPRLSVAVIHQAFKHRQHSFTDTYRILLPINDYVNEENDKEQLKNILKVAPFLKDTERIVLKSERKIFMRRSSDPTLLVEIDEIPEINTKETRPIVTATEEQRAKDDEIRVAAEPGFVCACCFDDEVLFEDLCQCNEGHLVCSTCLCHYTNEQLDGKGVAQLQCMDMEATPKCEATYSRTQLRRAFSPKSFEKVEEKMFRFAFEQAEMDDGW